MITTSPIYGTEVGVGPDGHVVTRAALMEIQRQIAASMEASFLAGCPTTTSAPTASPTVYLHGWHGWTPIGNMTSIVYADRARPDRAVPQADRPRTRTLS